MDGVARGTQVKLYTRQCSGIRGFHRGSFAMPISVQFALYTEIMAFIIVVEITCYKDWFPMWFKTDFQLLVLKVSTKSIYVPWKLRNR